MRPWTRTGDGESVNKRPTGNGYGTGLAAVVFCVAAALAAVPAKAAPISAVAVVDRQEIYLGESVTFQITIQGSEKPDNPDLTALNDFEVSNSRGMQNSPRIITTINGRVSENVQLGYIMQCTLTPRRAGVMEIPSVRVTAEGESASTQPVQIRVRRAEETDEFKLRISLSTNRCYAGEPVQATFTFYLTRDIRTLNMQWAGVDGTVMRIDDALLAREQGREYYSIGFGGSEAVAEKGSARLDGRDFTTMTVRKLITPLRPGRLAIPQTAAIFDVVVGQRRSSSPFDDPFFGSVFGPREVTERRVVQAPDVPRLEVISLPEAGRPAGFKGHIGAYSLETRATPLEVNVGDPITLSVRVRGAAAPDRVEFPPFGGQQALARDFKIPREEPAAAVEGRDKVFTQSIRALRADVREIPPLELQYFDPVSGEYRVAKSAPIPITVRETKIVEIADVLPDGGGAKPEDRGGGIAYNYEDESVLQNRDADPAALIFTPAYALLLAGPPLAWCVLFAVVTVRRRLDADPARVRARRAHAVFRRDMNAGGGAPACAEIMDAVRRYLGARLGIEGGALTYADVEPLLSRHGIPAATLVELKRLFEQCAAASYSGGGGAGADPAGTGESARKVIASIERDFA